MNVFIGNKLSSSIEKAQNVAAECALQDLGIPIEGEWIGSLVWNSNKWTLHNQLDNSDADVKSLDFFLIYSICLFGLQ